MTTAMGASLGGASFTVTADATKFQAALKDAKAASLQASQRIAGDLTGAGQTATTQFDTMGRNADKASKSLGKVNDQLKSKNSTHFALGLMAVGNAVDDLQYGFRSIVNNIPQIVYMFGGSAGLAGGAAIGAVAINQLMQHWNQLMDAMQSRWLGVAAADLEAARIKAEKAADAFGKLKQEMNPVQAEAANLWKKAIVEAPGGLEKFAEGMRGAIMGMPGLRPEETAVEKKERADLEREKKNIIPGVDVVADDRLRKIKKRLADMDKALADALDKKVEEYVGGVLVAGKEGDLYRSRVGEMLQDKKLGAQFTPEARNFGRMAEPDRVEKRLKNEREHEAEMRRLQEREAANKEAAGKMASGPLGTAILYGARTGGENAASRQQMEKMMKKNIAGSPMAERMMDQMQAKGFTPSQVQKALASMNAQDVNKRGHEIRQKDIAFGRIGPGEGVGKFGQLNQKYVGQAREELFNEAMKRGVEPAISPLEQAAKQLMKNAGIAGDPKGVLNEMKKLLEERRSDIMARTGASREQAEQIMKREQMQAAQGAMGPPAQRMGLVEFSHFTQGGILNNNIPAQQLEQLRRMNVTLDAIAKRPERKWPAEAGK
jgi:hypothetical protein